MRRLFAILSGLLCAAPCVAQPTVPAADSSTPRLPRWHVGFTAEAGQPVGAFRRHVTRAAGGQAHLQLRLDRTGHASLRVQGGWMNYGHESQRSCLGTAPHCRVTVNLSTVNGIFSLALGPQYSVPLGRARAYAHGLVGMSRFATLSGLGGGLLPDFVGADENFGDGGVMWRGGAGLQWPFRRHTTLDMGVSVERHGRRAYLLEGGLTDRPDGSLGFDITRSNAALYVMHVGVTTALRRTPRLASLVR